MTSLEKVLRSFRGEVSLLRQLFDGQIPLLTLGGMWKNPIPIAVHAYLVIRLLIAWTYFCRTVVLLSARGHVNTVTGAYLPRSPVAAQGLSAIAALKATYPPPRRARPLWEPKWYEPAEAIDAAQRLKIANFATVSAGLGLAGFGVEDLRLVRNFLAHRSEFADQQLHAVRKRLGLSLSTSPEELLVTLVPGGATLFQTWCWELLQRATDAVQ